MVVCYVISVVIWRRVVVWQFVSAVVSVDAYYCLFISFIRAWPCFLGSWLCFPFFSFLFSTFVGEFFLCPANHKQTGLETDTMGILMWEIKQHRYAQILDGCIDAYVKIWSAYAKKKLNTGFSCLPEQSLTIEDYVRDKWSCDVYPGRC